MFVAWLDGTEAWLYQSMALRICLMIWHHQSKATWKKQIGKIPLEHTTTKDFKKIEFEHPENIKTILATTSANHPGEGITLRQNRSTSHIPSIWGTRARSERPLAGPEKYTEVLGNDKSKQNVRNFGSSKNALFSKNVRRVTRRDRSLVILISGAKHVFDDMTPPIESHMQEKHGKNMVGPNDHKRFLENRVWTPRKYKNDFSDDFGQSPRWAYYSSADTPHQVRVLHWKCIYDKDIPPAHCPAVVRTPSPAIQHTWNMEPKFDAHSPARKPGAIQSSKTTSANVTHNNDIRSPPGKHFSLKQTNLNTPWTQT